MLGSVSFLAWSLCGTIFGTRLAISLEVYGRLFVYGSYDPNLEASRNLFAIFTIGWGLRVLYICKREIVFLRADPDVLMVVLLIQCL